MDNRPAWMVRGNQDDNAAIPEDASRKKSRAWVFTAQIFTTLAANINPLMPLYVDNGLPGIELWFGNDCNSEAVLVCHLDSCAATNNGNLRVYQWLMTTYPHLVSEYIQYGDSTPFQPLQLSCVVTDVERE